ncbi:hypothetical protein MLD38_038564 [Melastoma candidum]|uniref:Uncharacterized protein n=1 Tax=Melastoma candidum TaxID=119954 RepID=A0ACB9L0K3_9MYRT|nr:hypothetical protein MLD38_038564 [Melastoma candidum]
MAEKEKVVVKEKETVINAVYRVNLHCPECAREIRRPLLRTQGVHGVEVSLEKNEVKVKGEIDPLKIHKRIERLCKRKVELISPKIQVKETVEKEKVVVKEVKKELPVRTIHLKAYMHCNKCEQDLRRKLICHKAIFGVETDYKAQTLTVKGTIEPEKLLAYVRRKVNKRAEIIKQVTEKEEKKEGKKEEKKEGKKEEKKEEKKEKAVEKEKVVEKDKVVEKVKVVETKTTEVVEVKTKEGQPYFIHYVYAPQYFSDENPNACSIM